MGPSFLDSFPRNPSTYMNVGDNTYLTGTTTMRELMVVADHLAQPANRTIKGVPDPQLGGTEDQAAAEIRNFILRTLEEMIGQWGDVYSSNLLTYNGDYNTMYGSQPVTATWVTWPTIITITAIFCGPRPPSDAMTPPGLKHI
jgi:hypothetical protein